MAKLSLIEIRNSRDTWVNINIDVLEKEVREKFLNRKKAVDLYIDGIPVMVISNELGIPKSEIIRYVRKCITLNEEQQPAGYAALLPYKRFQKKPKKLQQLFLEYPKLEEFILGNYFNDPQYTLEHNMNIRTVHTKFIEECRRLKIQDYEFPFILKDKGYNILYRYIKQVKLDQQSKSIYREKKEIRQRFETTGYGESNNLTSLNPYGIVQIDGHKLDILYTVESENEQGETIYMPATRAWVIVIIDVATRAIIGYSISPYENYNQQDVLMAIHNAIVPHEKIEFTCKAFNYPENGGYPSLAIPEIEWATFDMIMLDNAKSHLAKNTVDKLLNSVKCTVNFGSVATPETRGIVERFFKTLEINGLHRIPATTGSNSKDNKRNNPEKKSVKYRITYKDICELLEYLIAEYNNSAHTFLENQTPLQVMERRIKQAGMMPYIISYEERNNIEKLTYFLEERIVRGGYSTGSKPQISYLGAKYHAYDRKIPMDMINKRAFIEVNPKDVSHVDLYDSSGIFIANLVAMGEWGRRSHSLRTRKAALVRKNKNKERNKVFSPDLSLYESELRENSKKSRRDRTKASIVKNELEQNKKTVELEKPIDYKRTKKMSNTQSYSKEELELINTLSIEEVYKRGLV